MATLSPELSGRRSSLSGELPGSTDSSMRSKRRKGGWVTFPFIIGSSTLLGLATYGAAANLIVYLVQEFNVSRIAAVQIFNIVNGCGAISPLVGGIISDSFAGCFSVILAASIISFLVRSCPSCISLARRANSQGLVPMTLTAILQSLRPPPCTSLSNSCKPPSAFQYAILYASLALVCVGIGGSRFTMTTFGANQFDDPKRQETFINWFFMAFSVAMILASTVVVFVQDTVGWGWGYGICLAANVISIVILLIGKWYYKEVKPQGSPFTGIARLVIAAIRKRKVALSKNVSDYFYQDDQMNTKQMCQVTSKFRAAIITEGDTHSDGSLAKHWRLCTTQQVEDLKSIINILPLWSSSIFLSTPIGVQSSLTILQALTMDRHLGAHFKIPASSFPVFALLAGSFFIAFLNLVVYPLCRKLLGWSPTLLLRIGAGHVLNITSMVASALVEARRLHVVHSHNLTKQKDYAIVPMSALWLVAPLVIVGAGEACHLPGQVSLYYEDFPTSLKGTATALMSVIIAVAFYLTAAIVNAVKKSTVWLPNDINYGRVDNVFWMLAVVGTLNFCYFILCAKWYRKQPSKCILEGLLSIN
ncbi:protein NRT1/ PTR FAMILY 2.7-like isoform X2 [Nymphaea colorata]|uniref:protein NRT1/ PTR FAMILY 2.7-like isoform X2 n=1 Tax=Nymphaea colorata TaxID=210225 RepID=UPI00214E1ACA|nr:protein NRT1/ PTR FAMILY 2.7-like isoform X2 [Nymphaea colorata]